MDVGREHRRGRVAHHGALREVERRGRRAELGLVRVVVEQVRDVARLDDVLEAQHRRVRAVDVHGVPVDRARLHLDAQRADDAHGRREAHDDGHAVPQRERRAVGRVDVEARDVRRRAVDDERRVVRERARRADERQF